MFRRDQELPDVQTIVKDLLLATDQKPPRPENLDLAQGITVGLLARSRVLLGALLTLSRAGFAEAGEGLARSILEHAATAGWLMADPDRRAAWFVRDTRLNYTRVYDEYTNTHGESPKTPPPSDEDRQLTRADQLPDLKARSVAAGLSHWYVAFRLYSGMQHSSVVSAQLERPKGLDVPYLAASASLYINLAQRVDDFTEWGVGSELLQLDARLRTIVGPELQPGSGQG